MLIHIYPLTPQRNIEVTICKHQADSPFYVWRDVWSGYLQLLKKSMVIHDTECPYWDQVSLNNTNQTKPNTLYTLNIYTKYTPEIAVKKIFDGKEICACVFCNLLIHAVYSFKYVYYSDSAICKYS